MPVNSDLVKAVEHIKRLESELSEIRKLFIEVRIESRLKAVSTLDLVSLGRSVSQSLCFVHILLFAFVTTDKRPVIKSLNKQIAARARGVWLEFL